MESYPSKIFNKKDLDGALKKVVQDYGVQASSDNLFRGAIFGRDSAWVGTFLLDIPEYRQVVETIILSLARGQGTHTDFTTEEEPGRIAHEQRRVDFAGAHQDIIERLASERGWFIPGKEFRSYTSVDATPLWVRLVCQYCERYGKDILQKEIIQHRTGAHTVQDALFAATSWIGQRIETSDIGLLESTRHNDKGVFWQVMRDGYASYMFANGVHANYRAPVAMIEVQGLVYDAFSAMGSLFHKENPRESAIWRKYAKKIQEKTLSLFWDSQREMFACALDREPCTSEVRLLDIITSAPADLLETGIFDGIEEAKRKKFITSIVAPCFSIEILTDIGIRAQSLQHTHLSTYWAYASPLTVWPIYTHLVIRGLRRQGFSQLANMLWTRLYNGINIAGDAAEFWYVDKDGSVIFDPKNQCQDASCITVIAPSIPESGQAWSVAAAIENIYISDDKNRQHEAQTFVGQEDFEETILKRIGDGHVLSLEQCREVFNARLRAVIDRDEGILREQKTIKEDETYVCYKHIVVNHKY